MRVHNKRTKHNTNSMEGGSGPRSEVHNKQIFILSGFTISDPDCNLFSDETVS